MILEILFNTLCEFVLFTIVGYIKIFFIWIWRKIKGKDSTFKECKEEYPIFSKK